MPASSTLLRSRGATPSHGSSSLLEDRIPTLPPLRRRLMPVPLGLDHPRWVDDPDFDLGDHLHRTALPAPAGEEEWRAKVAQVMGRPLTPGLPPWEMHLVEDMAGGRVGLIAKVHHAVIDGVAGATMLARLLDLTPGGWEVTHPVPALAPTAIAVPGLAAGRRAADTSSTARCGPGAPPARSAGQRCAWRVARSTRTRARSAFRSGRRTPSTQR